MAGGSGLGGIGVPRGLPQHSISSLLIGGRNTTPSGGSSVSSGGSISSTSLDTLYTGSSLSEPGPSCSPTPPPVPRRGMLTAVSQAQPPPCKVPNPEPPTEEEAVAAVVETAPAPVPDELEALRALNLGATEEKAVAEPAVPRTIGAELMELVRRNTGLSHELCRVAIGVVVGHIQASVPASSPVMEQVLLSLVEGKVRGQGRGQGPPRHPCPFPAHTCIQPLPDRYLLSSSSWLPCAGCWGLLGTIREGEREEEYCRQRLSLDEGHKAAPRAQLTGEIGTRPAWLERRKGEREGARGVVGSETRAGDRGDSGEDLEAVEFLGEGVQNRAGAPGGLDVGWGRGKLMGSSREEGGDRGLVHSLVLGGRWLQAALVGEAPGPWSDTGQERTPGSQGLG